MIFGIAELTESSISQLQLASAKRYGLLLLESFGQAQRFAGHVLPLYWPKPGAFEQELALAYQRDSSEVRQMAEGLGAELDLSSLTGFIPESADLLEQEDDAPIIRPINTRRGEGLKGGALDCLKIVEKRLVVRIRDDGRRKVLEGVTTLEEVLRVTRED